MGSLLADVYMLLSRSSAAELGESSMLMLMVGLQLILSYFCVITFGKPSAAYHNDDIAIQAHA
jgi:hypothetical protein